ncbi:MAG: exosortase/archaeosortase family protein, partial [Terriglobales bacterium]
LWARFAVLLAASLVVGCRSLLATFTLALHNDEYTHILLILPVSLALIAAEWPFLRQKISPSVRAGFAVIAIAILAAVYPILRSGSLAPDIALSIHMFALVLFWCGACILCFGMRVVRGLLFPLCFLLWLVPFPQAVLASVIDLLQRGSALSAHALFAAAGVPVLQDGVVLNIPGLTVEVAQECSSIRSSSMLLVTAMVLAHVLLRSPLRQALVIAVAVPLSVAKNGLRIFVISMLGIRVDPTYLHGRLHHQGGIIFFAIALAIVLLLIWLLKRPEDKAGAAPLLSEGRLT